MRSWGLTAPRPTGSACRVLGHSVKLKFSTKYCILTISTWKMSWYLSLLRRIKRYVSNRAILKCTSSEADMQKKEEDSLFSHHSLSCTFSGQRCRSLTPRGLRFTRHSIRLTELRFCSQVVQDSSKVCPTRGSTLRRTNGCFWTMEAQFMFTTLRRAQSDTEF